MELEANGDELWEKLKNNIDVDSLFDFCFNFQSCILIKRVWLICVAAALWSLWLARNDKIFDGKITNFKELLLQVKIRALLWVKAVDDLSCFTESSWWNTPFVCFKFQQDESDKRRPILSGYVTFIVDGAAFIHGAGCGGTLYTDLGLVRALFSGPVENEAYVKPFANNLFHSRSSTSPGLITHMNGCLLLVKPQVISASSLSIDVKLPKLTYKTEL
ncbi:hypothetical protein V6N11_020584 [Hibiscus sabdariffa]|uniref:Uncharacterized protein n=1 Tax=Hibiscus sabdariffa TaxID=183260 RepID=A0ABR2Q9C1_9ROSI